MSRAGYAIVAAALPLALLLAGCLASPPEAAVRQLALYKATTTPVERVAGETGEAIDCDDRHAVCADLWLTRAEALLALGTGYDLDFDERPGVLARAIAAAATSEARLPAPDPGTDPGGLMLRALKVQIVAETETMKFSNGDPSIVAPVIETIRRLAGRLEGVPGGPPYAAWFTIYAETVDLLITTPLADVPCPRLLALRRGLPAIASRDIAEPRARLEMFLYAAFQVRECAP